jgi:hypothetical protein
VLASAGTPRKSAAATLAAIACALLLAGGGCSDDARPEGWTVEEARAVTTVRGMNVRVLECVGRGPRRDTGAARYHRFACRAATRATQDAYDTVVVAYELRVRGAEGYVLENVRFHGGPGIP